MQGILHCLMYAGDKTVPEITVPVVHRGYYNSSVTKNGNRAKFNLKKSISGASFVKTKNRAKTEYFNQENRDEWDFFT